MIIKSEEFPALIDLIGLITSTDFNRLSIDLKLVIIDFRISADSQPYYLQIERDEESKKFNTLFQYNRLPFGIASTPSSFQRAMDSLVQGLPRVSAYLDNILVSGVCEEDHLNNLDKVLQRLESAGLTLKKSKCIFGLDCIEYLGHIIDKNRLHPSSERVKAIAEAPTPTNVTKLKSFLGLINYYNKFLSNLSMFLSPLYRLLKEKYPMVLVARSREGIQTS